MLKRQYMRELFWEKSMLYNISDCLNTEKHSLHGKPMQAVAFIESFSVFMPSLPLSGFLDALRRFRHNNNLRFRHGKNRDREHRQDSAPHLSF